MPEHEELKPMKCPKVRLLFDSDQSPRNERQAELYLIRLYLAR
jgi:hypothetical protein